MTLLHFLGSFDPPYISMLNSERCLCQVSLRRLGAQVCGLFVEVEEEKFSHRLDELLPLLEREIRPESYENVGDHTGGARGS